MTPERLEYVFITFSDCFPEPGGFNVLTSEALFHFPSLRCSSNGSGETIMMSILQFAVQKTRKLFTLRRLQSEVLFSSYFSSSLQQAP